MKKVKTLYVFNKEFWPELMTQKAELLKLAAPYIDYSQNGQTQTNITSIPWKDSLIPYEWLAQNIIPLSDGWYDQIVFHVPTNQWQGGNTNAFTYEGKGRPTIICVHSHQGEQLFNNPDPKWKDRGFYERTQHEFGHAICDILGIQDYVKINGEDKWQVHIYEDAGNLWKKPWFDYIGLTDESAAKIALIKQALEAAYKLLDILQKRLSFNILWKGSPDFFKGRSGYKPEAIVIHIMDGTLSGTDSWFASPQMPQVSAHYGVGEFEVHQYVKDEDTAWHCGKVLNPTWIGMKPGINPNFYTLGIEHEGYATSVWTGAMKLNSARLIRMLCNKFSIPIDRNHIIGHYEIYGAKPNCPAFNKSIIDELISLAKGL